MVDIKISIPDGFFDEEVRCGYTVTREMKEIWAVELDLLVELLRVCKKYDIKIFASGGTMLGAVRHNGFIPWDDDIDMRMMREDYEKLCTVAATEFREPYFFQTEITDSNSLRFHAQLRNSNTTGILCSEKEFAYPFNQGIFIDIFPMDKIPNNQHAFIRQCNLLDFYKKILFKLRKIELEIYDSHSRIKNFLCYVLHVCFVNILRQHKIQKRIYIKSERVCRKYNNQDFDKCIIFALNPLKQKTKMCNDYIDYVIFPFEFVNIPVSPNFDSILKQQYGDYMKFVIGNNYHGETIQDTNRSYKTFFEELVNKKM